MEISEIRDSNTLRDWLADLPQGTEGERGEARRWAVAIAHRAVMRALPVFWETYRFENEQIGEKSTKENGSELLSPERVALLITVILDNPAVELLEMLTHQVETCPSSPLSRAHVFAAHSLVYSGRSASENAARAVEAARTDVHEVSPHAENVSWLAIRADCEALAAGKSIHAESLWSNNNPLLGYWAALRSKILSQGECWRFWLDWYENALLGRPQDYDLLTKIALIDPKDWDKGADHVNALIQRIVAEHKDGASSAPARIAGSTVTHVQSSVAANGPVLTLQLGALLEVADQEIERIRGANQLEPEIRDGLLDALQRLKEAATEILALLPDSGAPSEAEAEEIASWGVILNQQAQHWNTEAKKFVAGRSADERIVFAGRLVLASAVAGPLSLMGLGAFAAVAGGAILLRDKLDVPKAIKSIKSGIPSS